MDKIIDAKKLCHYRLNTLLKESIKGRENIKKVIIKGVNGQRYIGAGLESTIPIIIEGLPGNDLASFAKSISLVVHGNTQDGVGNTMNNGEILVHGHGGDILAHSMRGGRIVVKKGVGTRVGIHMKATPDKVPKVIIGGGCGDFLAEYMAGGILTILRLWEDNLGSHIGTGMHGGMIYIRGKVKKTSLAAGLRKKEVIPNKESILFQEIERYCQVFHLKRGGLFRQVFTLITPESSRPYKNLYA